MHIAHDEFFRERERQTMKPKEKVPMTEREIETAESWISPMWPTKMLVTELIPNWHKMLKAMGPAIFHVFTVSLQKTRRTSPTVLAGA
jgi:hypothetical protein